MRSILITHQNISSMSSILTSSTGVVISSEIVSEWVGLHYKKNFDAESAEKQQEWVDRYTESHELVSDDVQEVVDDVLTRAKTFGFKPEGDMVRSAVDGSAVLLDIALFEAESAHACSLVTAALN